MSTNLYDLLDVEETATADEIRAAWKTAIADLDPTERRFRAYSDAAGVLLDPDKRAAYDADLAAERAARAAEAEDADDAADTAHTADTALPSSASVPPATATSTGESAEPPEPRSRRAPSTTAIVVAAIAAVLSVALAVTLALLPGSRGEESAKDQAGSNLRLERASVEAENAAERIVAPAFSYGYQTMDADLERVTQYLTEDLAAKQTKLWPELTAEAVKQEIVVEASTEGVALSRLGEDGDLATVVVFIRQDSTRKGAEPATLRMWATLQLVRDADSELGWLLDEICVDSECG